MAAICLGRHSRAQFALFTTSFFEHDEPVRRLFPRTEFVPELDKRIAVVVESFVRCKIAGDIPCLRPSKRLRSAKIPCGPWDVRDFFLLEYSTIKVLDHTYAK